MIVDISDSNVLRLKVLQAVDGKGGSFSDYLDGFLTQMIDEYVNQVFDNGYDPYDPKAAAMNELLDMRTPACNYTGISIELGQEDSDALREEFEELAYIRDLRGMESPIRGKRRPGFIFSGWKSMRGLEETADLAEDLVKDKVDALSYQTYRDAICGKTRETLRKPAKKKTAKTSKKPSQT